MTMGFETGALARLADGSCVASVGKTMVLATAVCRAPAAWGRRDRDNHLQVRPWLGAGTGFRMQGS